MEFSVYTFFVRDDRAPGREYSLLLSLLVLSRENEKRESDEERIESEVREGWRGRE